jgi:uncharacterized protein YkwD
MRAAILFVFLLVMASSFGIEPVLTDNKNVPNSNFDKKLILDLVNAARKKGCQCGDTYFYQAPPLKWNEKLEKAAFQHSQDMLENKYFSHNSPDGKKAGDRLDRLGYRWTAYGENIAQGYSSEKQVVEGWLSSPGHCRNIMNKMYREMGVGRSGNYWTQTFGVAK